MGADEALDVDPVDRRAALEAPVRVDRRQAAEGSESGGRDGASRRTPAGRGGACGGAPAGTNRRQPAKAAIIGRVTCAASIVVVSPHSDDGVLSLGASMARWVREGRDVELLTVLALDPGSDAPTKGWDGAPAS